MKIKVQVVIESEGNETPITDEIASITREDLTPETLGLTLAEAKELLASVQETMVQHQVTEYQDELLQDIEKNIERVKWYLWR